MNVRDRAGIVHSPWNYPERWDQGAPRNKFGMTRCSQWFRWSGQSPGLGGEFHGSPTAAALNCFECITEVEEIDLGIEFDVPTSYNSAVNDSKA